MKSSLVSRLLVLPILLGVAGPSVSMAQEHPYVPPSDPLVRETLEVWRDLKFGLLLEKIANLI